MRRKKDKARRQIEIKEVKVKRVIPGECKA
ncbi:uncharacterized protein G2W53_006125 [Senna tora]|uniref:Uncharacterized protein n=1 Tax=Senna tora TaxID=362788 RepID=A0A834X4Y7_9FABA|nr:uncharacterized protein G2W53_006125 [Senna tora]